MLKKLTATGVVAAAATTGALMFATPASADADTSGSHSVLGGNQVIAPITVPVNVCGVSVAVLGGSGAGCKGGAKVDAARARS